MVYNTRCVLIGHKIDKRLRMVTMAAEARVYVLLVSGKSGQSAQKAADKNIRAWLNSADAHRLLTEKKPESQAQPDKK